MGWGEALSVMLLVGHKLVATEGLGFGAVVQRFLNSMWPLSSDASPGIISKPAMPSILRRVLDVCL